MADVTINIAALSYKDGSGTKWKICISIPEINWGLAGIQIESRWILSQGRHHRCGRHGHGRTTFHTTQHLKIKFLQKSIKIQCEVEGYYIHSRCASQHCKKVHIYQNWHQRSSRGGPARATFRCAHASYRTALIFTVYVATGQEREVQGKYGRPTSKELVPALY